MMHCSLVEQLDRLALALIQLDHKALEDSGSYLESVAEELRQPHAPGLAQKSETELQRISAMLRSCIELNRSASDFYAGWARLASLTGAAYTPGGAERAFDSATSLARG